MTAPKAETLRHDQVKATAAPARRALMRSQAWHAALNGRFHTPALCVFTLIVLFHLAEHGAQAIQIWGLGESRAQARGLLGEPFPWLVSSEWLHYAYALVMLAGLALLRRGFNGAARSWWTLALILQIWHHGEHLLLLGQKVLGTNLAGEPAPTSLAQFLIPRVELHLFYNVVVLVPMTVAVLLLGRTPLPVDAAPTREPART